MSGERSVAQAQRELGDEFVTEYDRKDRRLRVIYDNATDRRRANPYRVTADRLPMSRPLRVRNARQKAIAKPGSRLIGLKRVQ
jgi:hypothetical protein